MITTNGLLLMLEAIIAKPLVLQLFTELDEQENLTEPENYTAHPLARDDWEVDTEKVIAKATKHRFRFTAPGGSVAGWALVARDERAVLAFDRFQAPYPINSTQDTVSVTPILRVRAPA